MKWPPSRRLACPPRPRRNNRRAGPSKRKPLPNLFAHAGDGDSYWLKWWKQPPCQMVMHTQPPASERGMIRVIVIADAISFLRCSWDERVQPSQSAGLFNQIHSLFDVENLVDGESRTLWKNRVTSAGIDQMTMQSHVNNATAATFQRDRVRFKNRRPKASSMCTFFQSSPR